MSRFDHFAYWRNDSKSIRDLRQCDEACLRSEQLFVFVEKHLTAVINRSDAQPRTLLGAKHLPRNDIGVMFKPGDNNFVVLLNVSAAPTLCHQIDAFCCPANEDDLARRGSVKE